MSEPMTVHDYLWNNLRELIDLRNDVVEEAFDFTPYVELGELEELPIFTQSMVVCGFLESSWAPGAVRMAK
jgi:hypothetical protein